MIEGLEKLNLMDPNSLKYIKNTVKGGTPLDNYSHCMKIDTRCPPLHKELAEAKILPLECDVDKCLLNIELAYENARSLNVELFNIINENETNAGKNFYKRWGNII